MSTIGYVDIQFADDYVTTHFVSTDMLRENWENLLEEDKEVLLRLSFENIEKLPFVGKKTDCTQQKAFPRFPSKEIPLDIMYAQVENAVEIGAQSSENSNTQLYQHLRANGIASYSIGDFSETLLDRSSDIYLSSGILSARAVKLLTAFVAGGYRIVR